MGKQFQINILDFIIAFVIIMLCFILTYKKKKTIKGIDIALLNKHILEYKPEPLVTDPEAVLLSKSVIEKLVPQDPNILNLVKVNYMNLLENEELKTKAEECIRMYGVGSCGPRGFYGTIDVHIDLENRIADFLGLEETVLYSYGFSTISSAIGAYCKKSDIIFCDEEISFPAVQGLVAARSTVIYFKHNNTSDLEAKLNEIAEKEKIKKKKSRKFLIVEGIYVKTGQICPLPRLIEISKKHKMRIFLNESISFGALGKTGRGVTEYYNVDRSEVDMIMGSLETSLGSIGGFCVGRSVIIEHQRLSGLGYCFSASLPPFLSYVALCAINMFDENPIIFKTLEDISIKMHERLETLDKFTVVSNPISPLKVICVKQDESTIAVDEIENYCANNGVYIVKDEHRLQLNVNIEMKNEEMNKIVNVLDAAVKNI